MNMSDKRMSLVYNCLVEEGFGQDIALLVVIFRAASTAIRIKPRHLKEPGSFGAKVRRKAAALTMPYDQEDVEIAYTIYAECLLGWDTELSLEGSSSKTFRQRYEATRKGGEIC